MVEVVPVAVLMISPFRGDDGLIHCVFIARCPVDEVQVQLSGRVAVTGN